MKTWEAFKALDEGKKVRCESWHPNIWYMYLIHQPDGTKEFRVSCGEANDAYWDWRGTNLASNDWKIISDEEAEAYERNRPPEKKTLISKLFCKFTENQ